MKAKEHKLRWMIRDLSENISDKELDELETKLPIEEYLDHDKYEYNGNFIISKNKNSRDKAVENMCCGITEKDVELSNKQFIYFAFDYGH